MTFGQNLKMIRKSKGFTQKQIADVLGIDKSTYSGYEIGKRSPDVDKIKQLANALGVTGDELLDINVDLETNKKAARADLSKEAARLMEEINKLSDDDLIRVLEYIQFLKTRQKQ